MFEIFLKKIRLPSIRNHGFRYISSSQNLVNLSYDLNDKYKSNKALVIAHGLFASKLSWRAIARRINEHTNQKVYTVDLRNHGNTEPYLNEMSYPEMANDLGNFIKTIVVDKDKAESITVMGHSMGGKTAMCLALTNPTYVDKLIVADIAPSISPSTINIKLYLEKMNSIDINSLDLNLHKARKQVDEILCELPVLKQDINQRQFLLTRLFQTKDGRINWHFNLKSIIKHLNEIMGFPEFKTKFDNSTLFMGGELSNYITEADVPSIQKYFNDYKIVKIPKAGHVIHFDNPADTIKTVDNFIN